MKSVLVNSSAAAIQTLLELTAADAPSQFVDYGCGTAEVLLAVARRFPDLPCIGVEIDERLVAAAQRRIAAAGLRNVELVHGDVLHHAALATDVAYLYLGGALNQRLGHALLARRRCRRVIAARYPIIGAVSTARIPSGSSSIYVYNAEQQASAVEWDQLATIVEIPLGSAYLMSRAIRVMTNAELSLSSKTLATQARAQLRSSEFGFSPARPGVPTICDILFDCEEQAPSKRATVFELSVMADGSVLHPPHVVAVMPSDAGEPKEHAVFDWAPFNAALSDADWRVSDGT